MGVGKLNTAGQHGSNDPFQRSLLALLKKGSPPGGGNVGTFTITSGTYIIEAEAKVLMIAMLPSSDCVATIQGTDTFEPFGESTPQDLTPELPTGISHPGFIRGLIIEVSAGSIELLTNRAV